MVSLYKALVMWVGGGAIQDDQGRVVFGFTKCPRMQSNNFTTVMAFMEGFWTMQVEEYLARLSGNRF